MKKGERAGYSRSQPRKAVSRSEPGIRSVRQEGKKSPGNRRTRQESNGRQWTNSWQGQNVELYSESDWRWGQWRRNWHDRWNWDDDCNTTSSFTHDSDTRGCEYFQSGFCNWGASCYFSHDWTDMDHSSMPDGPEWSHEHFSTEPLVDDPQTSATAGLVFVLAAEAFEAFETPSSEMMTEDTGPMRVRVVGDLDELGYSEELEEWDPNLGVDLCWEGDVWRSFVIAVEPETLVHFSLVRLDQPESHPGLLQGWRRWEMHEQRHFTWSPRHSLRAPKVVWLESLEIGFVCMSFGSLEVDNRFSNPFGQTRLDKYLHGIFQIIQRFQPEMYPLSTLLWPPYGPIVHMCSWVEPCMGAHEILQVYSARYLGIRD